MQHSSILSFVSMVFMLQMLIAFLGNYFLNKWSPFYKIPHAKKIYWVVSSVASLMVFFRRTIFESDHGQFNEVIKFLMSLSYIWAMGLLVMVVGFIVVAIFRLLQMAFGKITQTTQSATATLAENSSVNITTETNETTSTNSSMQMSRRSFLQNSAIAVPVLSFGVSTSGVLSANSTIVLKSHQVTIPNLAKEFAGFKIAQITDAHMGPYFGMEKLHRVIEMVKSEKPDTLVITGDLIDDLAFLSPALEALNPLAKELPYGAYFCWGNHEYFRDIGRIQKALASSAITVLKNENRLILKGDTPLYFLGVDYPFTGFGDNGKGLRKSFLNRAMANLPSKSTPILLSHHSDFIEEAFELGIPLTLSGHTHGGQVTFFGKSLLPVAYKYMLGMYISQNCSGYVSAGTGHWLPFRLNCPAEVSVFTLNPANPQA